MIKQELIKRSPIRILERSIHGGLGTGNLGVFTARKGTGKTACLVHVATDKLLRSQGVLHLSFADDPHHIEAWYKQVFQEVANTCKLDHAFEVYDEIIHNRLILHFKQSGVDFDRVKNNIDQILSGSDFLPEMLIVDGYSFDTADEKQVLAWQNYARVNNFEIWFSATLHRDDLQLNTRGIPAPVNKFEELFAVIIMLNPMQEFICLNLLKDHDSENLVPLKLKLDPKTLLIVNYRA